MDSLVFCSSLETRIYRTTLSGGALWPLVLGIVTLPGDDQLGGLNPECCGEPTNGGGPSLTVAVLQTPDRVVADAAFFLQLAQRQNPKPPELPQLLHVYLHNR